MGVRSLWCWRSWSCFRVLGAAVAALNSFSFRNLALLADRPHEAKQGLHHMRVAVARSSASSRLASRLLSMSAAHQFVLDPFALRQWDDPACTGTKMGRGRT